jgi:hypothetical protein
MASSAVFFGFMLIVFCCLSFILSICCQPYVDENENENENENGNNNEIICDFKYNDMEQGQSSYINEDEYDSGMECSICLMDMEMLDIERLRCEHMFHRECLSTWMKTKNICPICRSRGCCVRILID